MKKAFTLIELLVVIAIIGILSGVLVVSMNGATNAAKDAIRKNDISSMRKALLSYQILNGIPLLLVMILMIALLCLLL
jgi:prepilin-type N-terminal cleavage/methylation domain-containing protein